MEGSHIIDCKELKGISLVFGHDILELLFVEFGIGHILIQTKIVLVVVYLVGMYRNIYQIVSKAIMGL